jgi:hypothetical protein
VADPPNGRADAGRNTGSPGPAREPFFADEPVDPHRLGTDPAYRRAYEDWLDLQENLGRSPGEARRPDLLFVTVSLLLTAALVLFVILLFR